MTYKTPIVVEPLRVFALAAALSLGLPAFGAELRDELKAVPDKVVFETYQGNNWELFVVDADGSNPVNLTRTPDVNELYPHVSPDGSKIAFLVDEGEGASKSRNVYCMNADGTGRKLVAKNARDQCWNADSTAIAYLKGEFEEFCLKDYATKGLFIYDLKTGQHRQHPNHDLYHLYNLCWSPAGDWFVATVHGGMGYKHAILAIEADGPKVVDLAIPGCRPDLSPDGKRIAWGASDWVLRIADFDTSGPTPKVANQRDVVSSDKPLEAYHVDWSPDGKYIAFSRGPSHKRLGPAPEMIGVVAEGWNVWVADAAGTNRWLPLTTDGKADKEPDWMPVRKK